MLGGRGVATGASPEPVAERDDPEVATPPKKRWSIVAGLNSWRTNLFSSLDKNVNRFVTTGLLR